MATPTDSDAMTRGRALWLALLLALALTWFTGEITRWGQWYGDQPFYRAQVSAFFHGRLALTHDVEGITHDLAWANGGVQQVWGLGVPLWQAACELVGRAVHLSPFPDRIAMVLAQLLALYVLLRGWFGPGGDRTPASRGAFLLTAFLPALVVMMRGRIAVYEEAEAYAYGSAMLLVAGLLMMLRRPSTVRYVLLLAFAGATGLVRPTVWFAGATTALLATVLYVRWRGGLRRALAPVALAAALFIAGGAALYGTNYLRFGSGSEFGHRLNLEDLPGNIYATRFGYPFESVSTVTAAKEELGAMFDRPETRVRVGFHFYETDLHAMQAPDIRWREYYFTNYTWPYVPVLVAALALFAWCWWRAARGRETAPRDDEADISRETRWLGLWAILATAPLFVFYLHSPSLSSRYLLDLGPGIAVLLAIAWRHLASWLARRGLATLAFIALIAAWGYAIIDGKSRRLWASPVRAVAAMDSMLERTTPMPMLQDLPDAYDLHDPWIREYVGADQWECDCYLDAADEAACDHAGLAPDADVHEERTYDRIAKPNVIRLDHVGTACYGDGAGGVDDPDTELVERWRGNVLYLNGMQWDLTTGSIPPATYFFVDAPGEIEVTVAPLDRDDPAWQPAVRAKVQLEELALIATESTARGVRFRFAAPTRDDNRSGLQVLFLAFGPPENLAEAVSGYRLERVDWQHPPR